jgi:hypothetical protein
MTETTQTVADRNRRETVEMINNLAICREWEHIESLRDYLNMLLDQRGNNTVRINETGDAPKQWERDNAEMQLRQSLNAADRREHPEDYNWLPGVDEYPPNPFG